MKIDPPLGGGSGIPEGQAGGGGLQPLEDDQPKG